MMMAWIRLEAVKMGRSRLIPDMFQRKQQWYFGMEVQGKERIKNRWVYGGAILPSWWKGDIQNVKTEQDLEAQTNLFYY